MSVLYDHPAKSSNKDEINSSISQEKDIYDPNYRAALRKFFMDAMNSNQDLLIDHEGNIILTETRLVLHRYEWNNKTKNFDKVYNGARFRKKSSISNSYEEVVEEDN